MFHYILQGKELYSNSIFEDYQGRTVFEYRSAHLGESHVVVFCSFTNLNLVFIRFILSSRVNVASLFAWLLNVKVESSDGDAVEEIGGMSLNPADIIDVAGDGIVRIGVMEAVKVDTGSSGMEEEEEEEEEEEGGEGGEGIDRDKGSV